MTSQLVALATQSRNASEPEPELELDELDDEVVGSHMFINACRQLSLFRELVDDVDVDDDDVAKHVPHLAMMLSTALSHLDGAGVQTAPLAVKARREIATNPRKARFMSFPSPGSSND